MSLAGDEFTEIHWMMETLQSVDVGLVVLDRHYHVQLWNGFMESHSGMLPSDVLDRNFFNLFPDVHEPSLRRKIESAFLLRNRSYTTWEQRPYLIRFKSYRPITGSAPWMYQNVTIIPLSGLAGVVTHVCIIIYDVTERAVGQQALQGANDELAKLSQTDGLTQLYNRAAWEGMLAKEFQRCQRTGYACSMVMLDIDHFKKINDTHGHPAGDEAIRRVSAALRTEKRATDVAGRYGGEEFCVILIDTTAENSVVFAERLRLAVERMTVEWEKHSFQFTISLGIAQFTTDMPNHGAWLQRADEALYQSKQNGRNKTTVHGGHG